MINEIQEHIAELAFQINEHIHLEITIKADSPTEPYCSTSTRIQLRTLNYKTIYRTTLKQVLAITQEHFEKEEKINE